MSLAPPAVFALIAGLVAVPFTPAARPGPTGAQPFPTSYASWLKEAYLSPEALTYIRPGLHVRITSVTNVAPGKNPVVEILMTDDLGAPLDRNGVLTPGAIGAEFVLGQWSPDDYDYVNLTTVPFAPGVVYPLHDVGGTWTDVAVGDSRYTFATTLPSTFDVTQTVTLGIYASRSTTDLIGKDYVAPAALQVFRGDGGTPTPVFAAMATADCNKCHDPISMHEQFGPPIQDVRLCVMCHTSQMPNTPSGEPLTFGPLVHRIHDNKNVDFVPVTFPQDIRNCQTCHSGTGVDAIWSQRPDFDCCGSCHDNINWQTGANHPGGPQADESKCASCHVPTPDNPDVDAPIPVAHLVPYNSDQLHGLVMTILSVANAAPGQKPVVTFQVKDKNGVSLDPRPFDTLQFTFNGPTADYAKLPVSEDALAAVTFDGSKASYSFQHAIPANATGTWVITSDVEWTTIIHRPPLSDITDFTESPLNPVSYVAMTDPQPVPRRQSVDINKCNVCHKRLGAHGGRRLVTQNCVICHNPINDDSSQRAAGTGAPESIEFARMIHRIHTGENLTQDFTIYGHGGRAVNFNDVTFPGDRRDCLKCHVSSSTYSLPVASTNISVATQRDFFSPQGPGTTACTGCHDSRDVLAHAYINTANFPAAPTVPAESCGTCHGTGATFAVDKVHAR
jgi:OmcA/MtrC family decaheme c-type cytochrome